MNTIETKARDWIVSHTGYDAQEIVFSNNSSPDFTTPDGKGYEVKEIEGRRIIVRDRQWPRLLLGNCSFLAYRRKTDTFLHIPIRDIVDMKWEGLTVTIQKVSGTSQPREEFLAKVRRKEFYWQKEDQRVFQIVKRSKG